MLTRDNVLELTIEDPAEAFEDLRDKNDLKMLFVNQTFMEEAYGDKSLGGKGKLGPPTDKAWVEGWRVKMKIAKVFLHLSTCGFLFHTQGNHVASVPTFD